MTLKTSLLSLLLLAFVGSPMLSHAGPFKKTPEKLNQRILRSGERLDMIQMNPELRIPASLLARAQGIVILHQFKVGVIIGGEGGNGVALVRNKRTGAWSPPAFIANAEGSYGLQIGGQSTNTVLLLMDDLGMKLLTDGSVEIGVNLRATAGPRSEGTGAKLDNIDSPVLVYSDVSGLYAGAAIEGGGIIPAENQNKVYYGLTQDQILFQGLAPMTPAGQSLVNKINSYSRVAPAPNPVPGPGVPPRAVPLQQP